MKKISLISAVLIGLFQACDEVNLPLDPETNTNIEGTWEWVESTGGIAGWTIKPTPVEDYGTANSIYLAHTIFAEDEHLTIKVDNDSEQGLTIRESDYELTGDTNGSDKPFIELGANQMEVVPDLGGVFTFYDRMQVITVNDSLLILADDCTDCYMHTFKRIK